jgi:hypothetical protein
MERITEGYEIESAFQELSRLLTFGARKCPTTVGHQGGSQKRQVYWHERHGFWCVIGHNNPDRFGLSFGTDEPSLGHGVGIVCGANIGKSGVGGRWAGSFYREGKHTYLFHSGRVGGGRRGVSKTAFLDWPGQRCRVLRPEGVVIGDLSTSPSKLLSSVSKFVLSVKQFKIEATEVGSIDQFLARDADKADREGLFGARDARGERLRAIRAINIRRGQPEFRKKLLRLYTGRCALSGCDYPDALEAAHIERYWNEASNRTQNGLLLRGDLHTLFDLGKIGVDPKGFKIVVSDQLMKTVYREFHGRKIQLPANRKQWPSSESLYDHIRRWGLR